MDRERANSVYDMLRNAGYSRNKAKILALLEQVKGSRLETMVKLLGINSSRANQTLNFLLSQGFVQRMEKKDTPGVEAECDAKCACERPAHGVRQACQLQTEQLESGYGCCMAE